MLDDDKAVQILKRKQRVHYPGAAINIRDVQPVPGTARQGSCIAVSWIVHGTMM